MAMTATMVEGGLHHAVATGSITVGAGFGEVPATGVAQLMRIRLPFDPKVYAVPGFEDQFYVTAKSLDGNVTDIALNATQFEYDSTSPILRLNVTITAAPAACLIWLEAHHSIGR
jgi:hypothetical protein